MSEESDRLVAPLYPDADPNHVACVKADQLKLPPIDDPLLQLSEDPTEEKARYLSSDKRYLEDLAHLES